MTSSDIIAITAIILSAIVSIVSAYISYKNNKSNILAKRSEMAFERQLDAFQEVVEKIGMVRLINSQNLYLKDEQKIKNYFSELKNAKDEFYKSYQRQRVYLPPDIAEKTRLYGSGIFSFLSNGNYGEIDKYYSDLVMKEREIIFMIQTFMGYKKNGDALED